MYLAPALYEAGFVSAAHTPEDIRATLDAARDALASAGALSSAVAARGGLPRMPAMHIHILGVCGTFMGGLAAIAREAGHRVTGCDANVYPPMSDQLRALGIELLEGYGADQLALKPDLFVVGNVVTRGNPLIEAILDAGAPYTSGPQWLAEHVLQGRHVLAVAGTHGKTTTTSMLAWILECADLQARLPGGRGAAELRHLGARRRRATASSSRPTSTTPRSSTSAASSCTTGRAPRC